MEEEEDEAPFHIRSVRSRPDLGLGPSRALDFSASAGGAVFGHGRENDLQIRQDVAILTPSDPLPSYSLSSFTRRLSRRRRPRKTGKKRSEVVTENDVDDNNDHTDRTGLIMKMPPF